MASKSLSSEGTPRYGATSELRLFLDEHDYVIDPPPSYALHSIGALWRAGYKTEEEITKFSPEVAEYYRSQNELLHGFRKAASMHPFLSADDRDFLVALDEHDLQHQNQSSGWEEARREHIVRKAVISSNICNAFLLFAQVYAFASSGSLSMLAVFLDAVLDFVSGILVWFTWSMKKQKDKHRYPVGRSRLEPLGVMGMACLMTAATLLTLEESTSALLGGEGSVRFVGLSIPVTSVILLALFTKFSLFLYCGQVDDTSVAALREDHRNDVLSNLTSLITVFIAQYLFWWADAVGGIVISLLIIRNWTVHTLEHCDQLLGKAASRHISNLITFMACNHSSELRLVDTVRAYHVGNGIFAEVDIVLNADMPLHRAHDIGESLQVRIEQVEGVERCFVHLDTETEHSPSIEHKEL